MNGIVNDLVMWIIVLLIIIVVGVLVWTLIKVRTLINKLKKEVEKLGSACTAYNAAHDELSKKVDRLGKEVDDLREKTANIFQGTSLRPEESNNHEGYTEEEKKQLPESEKKTATQIRYATSQSPDSNGRLRFAEYAMVDQPSPKKMFLLEINPSTSSGTYRINPIAKNVILGNLQMFRDFVKPFAFSGNPKNANIEDKQVGKIKK